MLQDFAVGLWFRRLQKRVRKIRFFSILYPRFSNIVFPPAKSRLYALIFWFYSLLCKGHLSIFDLCWGDFTTPPSYYIGCLFQIFNHPPGSVEGKNLSSPRIGIVALSPPPGAGQRLQAVPIPLGKETGNQDATAPEPHKISHKSSYKPQQSDMSSCYHIVRPKVSWQPSDPIS